MVQPHKLFGRLGNNLFQYATLIALAHEAGSPDGVYFQDEKWFGKYEKDIQQIFGAGIGSRPEVSIHVRRGDYLILEHVYPNLCKTDYYQRAIEMFPPDTKFLVFSDDIEWCKNFAPFTKPNFSFSEGKSEVHDLNTMASCHHNILSNSTFAWWGAYLNRHEDKKIICPKREMWGSQIGLPITWTQI